MSATNGSVAGSATVTVSGATLSVVTAAAASPSPATGNTINLSVLGADSNGESAVSYTWSATTLPAGATATYSPNGTNAAKQSTVTVTKPGSYTFLATLSDGEAAVTSSVTVTVVQTLTTIAAANPTVAGGGTTQFAAADQFGTPLAATAVTWSATGGTISTAGLFTAGQTGGTFAVSGTSNGTTVTTPVTVVPTAYTGVAGGEAYAIRISPTDATVEQVFVNVPETAAPTYSIARGQLPNLSFVMPGTDGGLTVDFANGNPLPAAGVTATGGGGVVVTGAAAGGMSFTIGGGQVIYAGAPSSPIAFANTPAITFNLLGGSNTLTQASQPTADVVFNAGPGNNTLTVNGGLFTFTADPQPTSGSLTVNDNAAVTFVAPVAGTGFNVRHLQALNLGANATATLGSATAWTDRLVLRTSSLSVAAGATLDLGQNDLIVHGGDPVALANLVRSGLNQGGPSWTGTGINSSAAANDRAHLTAVGLMANTDGTNALDTAFDGQPADATDVFLKDTYYGDTNLDGAVGIADYSRIDAGFISAGALTGWFNGDVNYDGTIDGSDYTLVDNAFNMQASPTPTPTPTPMPAPAGTGPVVVAAASALADANAGETADLSVRATSAAGGGDLTYTWAATSAAGPAAGVTFTANGTNAASVSTATVPASGTYVFTVTVTGPGGQTATSAATVRLNQPPADVGEDRHAAPVAGSGVQPYDLGTIFLDTRVPVIFETAENPADRWVVIADSFTLASPDAQFDLGGNDLIVHDDASLTPRQLLARIEGYVRDGYAAGSGTPWLGNGLASAAAAEDDAGLAALAVMLNMDANGRPLYTTWDGQPVSATDVLVKYTPVGGRLGSQAI